MEAIELAERVSAHGSSPIPLSSIMDSKVIHHEILPTPTGSDIVSEPFSEVEVEAPADAPTLKPVDGGFAAWSMLAAAFLMEILVWGYPGAFGVLLAAYLDDPVYASQKNATKMLPLIGTLCSGILYCSGIVIYPAMHYYPHVRQKFLYIGTLISIASLVGASFTTKVINIVILQGIVFSIGGSILYGPVLSYMSEWFVKKRGLANGILFAGTSAGGVLFPFIFPPLIARWGIMHTMRIYAVAFSLCVLPALPFIKPRLPIARVRGPGPRARTGYSGNGWFKDRNFWFFMVINTIQGFGHFVPLIWLPTFASSLSLSPAQSSLSLALISISSIPAACINGYLSDRLSVWALAIFSLISTSLATFVVWGILSYSLAGILAYGIIYGGTAGGFTSMWNGFVKPIAKDDPVLATTIFGFLMLGRGIGSVLSTPISTALQPAGLTTVEPMHEKYKSGFSVANGRYEGMIVYSGTVFAVAAVVALIGWGLERVAKR